MKLLSRTEYDAWMKTLDPEVCLFCDWRNTQIILKEFEHWVWIANLAPYWKWHTLIIPKRHIIEFDEQTYKESAELISVLAHAKKKLLDQTEIEKIVFFWRFRKNRVDAVSKTVRPNHFHVHITRDIDHRWDSTIEPDAHLVDIVGALAEG